MKDLSGDLFFVVITAGIVLLAASLFIIIRRRREGAVILFLALLAGTASERACFAMFDFPATEAGSVYLSSVTVFSAAAVIIYIFFSRGSPAERLFTVVFLFSACLQAGFGIYCGGAGPAAVIAGTTVGSVSAAFFFTVFSWGIKYHSSLHQ